MQNMIKKIKIVKSYKKKCKSQNVNKPRRQKAFVTLSRLKKQINRMKKPTNQISASTYAPRGKNHVAQNCALDLSKKYIQKIQQFERKIQSKFRKLNLQKSTFSNQAQNFQAKWDHHSRAQKMQRSN